MAGRVKADCGANYSYALKHLTAIGLWSWRLVIISAQRVFICVELVVVATIELHSSARVPQALLKRLRGGARRCPNRPEIAGSARSGLFLIPCPKQSEPGGGRSARPTQTRLRLSTEAPASSW